MSEEPDAGTAKFLRDTDKSLDGVAAVMHTFATGGIRWRSATSADGLRSAAILAHPEPYKARAGLMTTAAVIRSAAQETGKSEDESSPSWGAAWPPKARLPQGSFPNKPDHPGTGSARARVDDPDLLSDYGPGCRE
jgi:hypothetical protein